MRAELHIVVKAFKNHLIINVLVYKKAQNKSILDNKTFKHGLIYGKLIKFAAKNKKLHAIMKITLRSVIVLLSALALTTSCLDTDETEYTFYNDTAVTAFSLGTLNKYYLTKTKYTDKDSLVKESVTGSDYKFYIDQAGNRIYNNDSLPMGTDAAHVICTVSTMNSGVATFVYNDKDGKDSLAMYSSTDSVDFTKQKALRIYSNSGAEYRNYKVSINVHKEDPDSFRWSNCANVSAFTTMSGMKAVCIGGKLAVLGASGNKTLVYTTTDNDDNSDGQTWSKVSELNDAEAYKNIALLDGTLYAVSEGKLMSTTDCATWTEVGAFGAKTLAGAGSKNLYAITADGKITASADKGLTWADEAVSDDSKYLPDGAVSMAVLPSKTNSDTETLVLSGLCSQSADTAAVVWNKVEQYGSNVDAQLWVRLAADNNILLPALANITMIKYGSVLVAMGGKPMNGADSEAFKYLYMSLDGGLTWDTASKYILPEGFNNGLSDTFAIAAGKNNILWIVSGGTGKVWRGRLNRLGWTTYKDSFNE